MSPDQRQTMHCCPFLMPALGTVTLLLGACATPTLGVRYDLALVRVEAPGVGGPIVVASTERGAPMIASGLSIDASADDRAFYLTVGNGGSSTATVDWDGSYVLKPSGGKVRLAVGTAAREEYRTLPRDHGEERGEERILVLADRIWRQDIASGTETKVIGVPTPVSDLSTFQMFDYSMSCDELLAQQVSVVVPLILDGLPAEHRLVFVLTRVQYAPQNPESAVTRKTCGR